LIRVYLEGIGLAGPGLKGWDAAQAVLSGADTYLPEETAIPASALLPAAERRRAGVPVRLALAVAHEAFTQAGSDPAATPTFFTSSSGDAHNVHALLEALATPEREVSPTRFHNSVHNAPAGYWSIAAQAREPSTSVCAFDASFTAGLLDAVTQIAADGKPVALIAYDHPYPEPLHATRPLVATFGVAFVLARERGDAALGMLEVDVTAADARPTGFADAQLERLRTGVPAARSLPILSALARKAPADVTLEYIADVQLAVRVVPCA
jgi:hypothetical protein